MPDSATKLESIEMKKNFERDGNGNLTDKISSYDLSQSVEVTSRDVDRVADLSRSATALIKDDVLIESTTPRYPYTQLAGLRFRCS